MQGLHSLAWAFFMADDNTAAIEQIDKTLAGAARSVSSDGVSASVDLGLLQSQRRDLANSDKATIAAGGGRPRVLGFNLGGAF
jgi:hypothetical protein